MAKLVINISDPRDEFNNIDRRNKKTPAKRNSKVVRRVINIANYHPDINYAKLARDICHDNRDNYFGCEVYTDPGEK